MSFGKEVKIGLTVVLTLATLTIGVLVFRAMRSRAPVATAPPDLEALAKAPDRTADASRRDKPSGQKSSKKESSAKSGNDSGSHAPVHAEPAKLALPEADHAGGSPSWTNAEGRPQVGEESDPVTAENSSPKKNSLEPPSLMRGGQPEPSHLAPESRYHSRYGGPESTTGPGNATAGEQGGHGPQFQASEGRISPPPSNSLRLSEPAADDASPERNDYPAVHRGYGTAPPQELDGNGFPKHQAQPVAPPQGEDGSGQRTAPRQVVPVADHRDSAAVANGQHRPGNPASGHRPASSVMRDAYVVETAGTAAAPGGQHQASSSGSTPVGSQRRVPYGSQANQVYSAEGGYRGAAQGSSKPIGHQVPGRPSYGQSSAAYGQSPAAQFTAPSAGRTFQAVAATHSDAAGGVYHVEPGDSFWAISQKVYGDGGFFKALEAHNRSRFAQSSRLQVGDEILTPELEELRERYSGLCPKVRTIKPGTPQVSAASLGVVSSGRVYVVEEGDTLYEIARYELGAARRWPEIYTLNRSVLGDDIDYIRPGTRLQLPGSERDSESASQSGDTLTRSRSAPLRR